MKKLACILAMLCLLATNITTAFPATEDSVTKDIRSVKPYLKPVQVITCTFVDGDDDDAIARTLIAKKITGLIIGFHYTPDGTATPAATGDIQVYNASTGGVNLLYAAGDNIGDTETFCMPVESTNSGSIFIAEQDLYLYCAQLDTADATGTLEIYVILP